jgi:dethiobiotin synthetase
VTTQRVFIAGTDTGVGKTHFAVWLIGQLRRQGFSVGAYKPACSGAVQVSGECIWEDAERLHVSIGDSWPKQRVCPQRFTLPLAPPVAAALEGQSVDEELLVQGARWWDGRVDLLVIEGAGGWYSPMSHQWTNADLAARLNAPVLLVAGNRLGVINHALTSIEVIARTCRLSGLVLNEPTPPTSGGLPASFDPLMSNWEEIRRRTSVPCLGILRHGESPTFEPHEPGDWRRWLFLETGPEMRPVV